MSDLATIDQARARADRIRARAEAVADWLSDIRGAYASRDWEPLGYATWHDYLDGEFGAHRIPLPVEERREIVAVMSRAGMSTRAIAPALGVSPATVKRDLPTGSNEPVESPRVVQSLDGRSRPAVQPPRPRPEPVTDSAPAVRDEPSDAELYGQLDDRMADTAARFRTLFAEAMAKADDVWQFNHDRVIEVVDHDDLRVFTSSWRHWCDEIDRQVSPGLRIVGGNR